MGKNQRERAILTRMPDPITLMDHLTIVIPCGECQNEVNVPFSLASARQSLDCGVCGTIITFHLSGTMTGAVEKGFQDIQRHIRDAGCSVGVRPST